MLFEGDYTPFGKLCRGVPFINVLNRHIFSYQTKRDYSTILFKIRENEKEKIDDFGPFTLSKGSSYSRPFDIIYLRHFFHVLSPYAILPDVIFRRCFFPSTPDIQMTFSGRNNSKH